MKQGDVLYKKLCPCVCSGSFSLLKFQIQSRMLLPLPRGQKASGSVGSVTAEGKVPSPQGHGLLMTISSISSSLKIR